MKNIWTIYDSPYIKHNKNTVSLQLCYLLSELICNMALINRRRDLCGTGLAQRDVCRAPGVRGNRIIFQMFRHLTEASLLVRDP